MWTTSQTLLLENARLTRATYAPKLYEWTDRAAGLCSLRGPRWLTRIGAYLGDATGAGGSPCQARTYYVRTACARIACFEIRAANCVSQFVSGGSHSFRFRGADTAAGRRTDRPCGALLSERIYGCEQAKVRAGFATRTPKATRMSLERLSLFRGGSHNLSSGGAGLRPNESDIRSRAHRSRMDNFTDIFDLVKF